MGKEKELAEQMFPEPQMENYDDILEYRNDRDWTFIARGAFVKGYEQAKEEMMKDALPAVVKEGKRVKNTYVITSYVLFDGKYTKDSRIKMIVIPSDNK